MKRRKLGLLVGSSLAYAAVLRSARAQTIGATPDPSLLTTTLTPLGAERAGNADGSIPAWTGGMVAAPDSPVGIRVFEDEQPLLTVDASNMAQHAGLLSDGVKEMITTLGFSITVYPTHRTAAASQFVYDNAAKNVTRAQFSPKGGRFGFTGAYGGPPFPIIDTANPDIAGPQLIWNHLTAWSGFCTTTFSSGFVVTDGELVLSEGGKNLFRRPYYDPEGSPKTFDGYLSKVHLLFQAPANFNGQEALTWHSANTELNADITWELLNGQGRVRKAPNEQYDSPNGYFNGSSNQDEASGFYGNPSQYDWKYLGKKEMYIPYHNNNIPFATGPEFMLAKYPNPDLIRWEKHRVWVLEATLHPGIDNVLSRRRFYIDEDSWNIAVGEGYDRDDNMASIYLQLLRVVPAVPCVNPTGFINYHPKQNNYLYAGLLKVPGLDVPEDNSVIQASLFDPQLLAAKASF
jgi:hypothetical protein